MHVGDDDNRAESGWRPWRRAQLTSQWPYLLTAIALGVAIPISTGVPDLDRPFGSHREVGVLSVSIGTSVGLFLALAAITGRRRRELVLAGIAFGIAATHPGLETGIGSFDSDLQALTRFALGAAAGASAAFMGAPTHRVASAVRSLTVLLATVTVGISSAHLVAGPGHLAPAASLSLALTLLLAGSLAHVSGVREMDGGLVAVGVLAVSAGLGLVLGLVSGISGLTIGVAAMTMVSVILAAVAALIAFLDALERRDQSRDTHRLARTLQLARLAAQTERHAELAHDHGTALLAIEAAARRLRDHPSGELADSVATEAARLQRTLAGSTTELGRFSVGEVVSAVVTCSTARYGPIELNLEEPTHAWGQVDSTAEIVVALLDNAHEHGTAPIVVDVTAADNGIVVSVRDRGAGVPAALRHVVFERGVTSAPSDHSGLGLFTARRLARESGGELTIDQGDAAGFVLRLPVQPPEDLEIDVRSGSGQADPRSVLG